MSATRASTGSSSTGSSRGSLHLVARLQRQEPDAWRQLVEVYAPFVHDACRRAGLHAADVADIGQEVFEAAARHIATFDRTRPGATLRGWLRVITRNKIHDHFRRAGAADQGGGGTTMLQRLQAVQAPEPEDSTSQTGDERAAEDALLQSALARIRAEFQPSTWQAFLRVVVGGRTAGEAGAELGMSPGAVRVAKARVLKRLREDLGDGPGP